MVPCNASMGGKGERETVTLPFSDDASPAECFPNPFSCPAPGHKGVAKRIVLRVRPISSPVGELIA